MDFATARHNMCENQIRTSGVTDARLLSALDTVPRELFVPEPLRGIAYVDEDIDLAPGRRMLDPMTFARMMQAAAIRPNEVVLDVGCGTGYSSAVLARVASTVVALESDRGLAQRAAALFDEQGVDNVALVEGPLAQGDVGHGPYDVIVIEGAAAQTPDGLRRQLAERGRLLAVQTRPGKVGQATITLRVGDSFSSRPLFEASATLLPGFSASPGFVF